MRSNSEKSKKSIDKELVDVAIHEKRKTSIEGKRKMNLDKLNFPPPKGSNRKPSKEIAGKNSSKSRFSSKDKYKRDSIKIDL